MAANNAFVLKNAVVAIDGQNISTLIKEVEVAMTAADVNTTGMGAYGNQHLAGIRDDSFTFTAYSSFGASQLNGLYGTKFYAGGTIEIKVTANGTTLGTSNPMYIGYGSPLTFTPIGGAVGDAATTQLTCPVSGTITETTSGTIP